MPIAREHVQMTSVLMRQYSCLNRKYYNRRVPRAYVLVSLGPLRSLNAYQVSVSAGAALSDIAARRWARPGRKIAEFGR